MDTKNVIAAISLSAAVIIIYALFFGPSPEQIKKAQEQKNQITQNSETPSLDASQTTSKISKDNNEPNDSHKENNDQTELNKNKSDVDNKEFLPEDKIKDLEDKLTRSFAEMENQRRRFEKEREDAFEYGGFAFAKEALSLIDNLERSKNILENDEKLK